MAAMGDTPPYYQLIVHKPGAHRVYSPCMIFQLTDSCTGDACSNDNSQVLGQFPLVNECKLTRDKQQFEVCGTLANFADEGPVIIDEGGCQTGFVLSINGKSYSGETLAFDDDRCEQTCHSAGSFGTVYGSVLFLDVPICA
jgi:hypothetical protein